MLVLFWWVRKREREREREREGYVPISWSLCYASGRFTDSSIVASVWDQLIFIQSTHTETTISDDFESETVADGGGGWVGCLGSVEEEDALWESVFLSQLYALFFFGLSVVCHVLAWWKPLLCPQGTH